MSIDNLVVSGSCAILTTATPRTSTYMQQRWMFITGYSTCINTSCQCHSV